MTITVSPGIGGKNPSPAVVAKSTGSAHAESTSASSHDSTCPHSSTTHATMRPSLDGTAPPHHGVSPVLP